MHSTSSKILSPHPDPQPILDEIVAHKYQEVRQIKEKLPLPKLQDRLNHLLAFLSAQTFLVALQQSAAQPSIIAEVKKASPSRGVIRDTFDPVAIAQAYERAGATCLSVLTDRKFFQGSFDNLWSIRQAVNLPLLCKEFIVDSYQIYLARLKGADAILLIAAILTDSKLQEFLDLAHQLGMDTLVEVHTLAELDRVLALSNVKLLGINNRNLADFTVNLATTPEMIAARRSKLIRFTIVSESGLYTRADLTLMSRAGVRAVLVGESLIKQPDIEQALSSLLSEPGESLS
jgi:indole-3-glycerol phosphate synthase